MPLRNLHLTQEKAGPHGKGRVAHPLWVTCFVDNDNGCLQTVAHDCPSCQLLFKYDNSAEHPQQPPAWSHKIVVVSSLAERAPQRCSSAS